MVRILFIMMLPFMCFSQITPREDIPVNNILKEKENFNAKRKAFYNLDEIKVRWKKAALENCPGVPCVVTTIPGAPTGVVVTSGNTTASVAFVAPTNNGGSAITGYTVTTNPGGITATGATSPINVTGLTNGTAYTFTVIATNAVGNSVASTASTAVTPVAPNTVPGAPTGVVATVGNSVSVSFVAPNNGGTAITGYTVTSNPATSPVTGTTSPIIVTGLTNGTSYTFTVVATNAIGNSVASSASTAVTAFTCGTGTISDIDNNPYNTVLIGTQCWTKENLKVTKYNDGTPIPDLTLAGWPSASGARTEYVATGVSSSDYVGTFGYLYNWYAVNDPRKLCPDGWHVPTDAEWTNLIIFVDPAGNPSTVGNESNSAGTELKSTVTNLSYGSSDLGWNKSPITTGGTNSSGFSALPGGDRETNGVFNNLRVVAKFWSATENINMAWFRSLYDFGGSVLRSFTDKKEGASVRCLKN